MAVTTITTGVGLGGGGVGAAGLVGAGRGVGEAASGAEVGGVGGARVGGAAEGELVRATGLAVGVPSMLMTVLGCRTKKKITAARMTTSPSTSATQGQRFDGSSGPLGGGGATRVISYALSAHSMPQ